MKKDYKFLMKVDIKRKKRIPLTEYERDELIKLTTNRDIEPKDIYTYLRPSLINELEYLIDKIENQTINEKERIAYDEICKYWDIECVFNDEDKFNKLISSQTEEQKKYRINEREKIIDILNN